MKNTLFLLVAGLLLSGRVAVAALSPSGDVTGATDHAAITAAIAGGGMVELGEGTFYVNAQIELTGAVTVRGAGRDVTTVTQAATSGNIRRVFMLNHADAVLEGVTVSGGYVYNSNNDGAGVLIDANGGTVRDCRITNCESSMNSYGALALKSALAVVKRTIIDGNFNKNGYGFCPGVYMAKGILENCLITGNYITSCANRAFPVAAGVFVAKNVSSSTQTLIRNCTITANAGRDVGGFCSWDGFGYGACTLENCIIAGNTVVNNSAKMNESVVHAPEYCCNGGTVMASCCLAEPKFKSVSDFHLSSASPCRGAADYAAWMAGETDLDGVTLPTGGKVDLGCYQYVASATFVCEIEADVPTAFVGDAVGFRAVYEAGVDVSAYTFTWTVGSFSAEGEEVEIVLPAKGAYDVKLTVTAGGDTIYETEQAGLVSVYDRIVNISTNDDIAAAFADVVDGQVIIFTDEDTYDFPGCITVSAAVTIRGQGRDKTILAMKSGANSRFFTLNNAGATLTGVTLQGGGGRGTNVCYGDGGAVYIDSRGGTVADCRLTDNHCGMNDSGMAVYMKSADAHVTRCIIDNNTTASPWPSGGAVTMTAGTIDNCLFVGNRVADGNQRTAYEAGALTMSGGVVSNCTFAANEGYGVGGVHVNNLSGVRLVNCVLYGNTVAKSVKGGTLADCPDFAGKAENVVTSLVSPEADPFRSLAAADYRLGANSPALGTGTYVASMDNELDLLGNPRASSGAVDMGCYENLGYDDWIEITAIPDLYGTVSPTFGLMDGLEAGDKVTCSLLTRPTGDDAPTFAGWRIEDAAGETVASGATESFEYEHNGEFRRVVWLWSTKFPMTVTTDGGGTVVVSVDEAAYGESVTFTATPDPTVQGVVFWKWQGDVPAGHETVNPLTLTVDAAKTLKAVFGAAKTYVAPTDAPNAAPSAPYTTPSTAANCVDDALSVTVDGGVVELLDGIHEVSNAVSIARALTVRGQHGRDSVTLKRVNTTLNGICRVALLNHPAAVLEGVTVTGGYTYGSSDGNGSGVRIDANGGTVRDCRVSGNEASMNCVGAVALVGAVARLSRTIVTDNVNSSNNGNCPGVCLSAGVMDSCLVCGNRITDCSQRKFQVPGGVQMDGGTMRNCTVTANHGRGIGGICFWDGYNWKGGNAVNCIVYGNTAQEDYAVATSPEYYVNDESKLVNCLFTDPQFAGAASGNYHLAVGSPARDAGLYDSTWMDEALDLDGRPRVKYVKEKHGERIGFVDLGCFESRYADSRTLLIVR